METIDIYNEKKEKTGEVLPRKSKLKKGQYMLYVLALIENNGRYLITRRTLDKKWAAGSWEIPGGGAKAGETSFEALVREVYEETHLDVSECVKEPIYSYCNEDLKSGDNYFADIYLCSLPFSLKDIHIQEKEVLDVRLASLHEIDELYQQYGFLHYQRILEALQSIKK